MYTEHYAAYKSVRVTGTTAARLKVYEINVIPQMVVEFYKNKNGRPIPSRTRPCFCHV